MNKLSDKTKHNLFSFLFWVCIISGGVFALGAILFFIYIIPLTVATHSASYFFFTAGISVLLAEFFLIFFCLSFYTVKAKQSEKIEKLEKHKRAFDISKIVLAVVAAVFLFLLAILDNQSPDTLSRGKQYYLMQNGYYADAEKMEIGYLADDITEIIIDCPDKNVVVKYTAVNGDLIKIIFYNQYENQTNISPDGSVLKLNVTPSPKPNNALNNMCFFMFDQSKNDMQTIIYIPEGKTVTIKGNYILAKD